MRKNNIQEMKTIDAPSTLHRTYDESDTTNAQKQWVSFAFWLLTRQDMICIRNNANRSFRLEMSTSGKS